MKTVTVNYFRVIWDVNINLAKIKDGKGKESLICSQEKFAHKNLAKMPLTGYFSMAATTLPWAKPGYEVERICDGLSSF
jgi:hypothetical protein